MKPGDEDRMSPEGIDQRHAWIVFRRWVRRALLAQTRRELQCPGAQSVPITADRTLQPVPVSADDSYG